MEFKFSKRKDVLRRTTVRIPSNAFIYLSKISFVRLYNSFKTSEQYEATQVNMYVRLLPFLGFAGVKLLRYTADLGDPSTNPMEKCFCTSPEVCLPRNFYDMTKCLGVPIIASLPHFYDTDGRYNKLVDGLNPNQVID